MENFKVGNVVNLKSGGPKMTIEHIDSKMETISCSWFNKEKLKNGKFHPDELKLSDKN